MEHAIRTSLQMFNDNLPYIENYIRKTLGITDPEGVAAEVQRMYNEAVARHEAKLQDALRLWVCDCRLRRGVCGGDRVYRQDQAADYARGDCGQQPAGLEHRPWRISGQWVDNAPKGWTEAELAGMQAAEAEKAAEAEEAADWAEWEQGMAQRRPRWRPARVPGKGKWQVIDRWNEVTTGSMLTAGRSPSIRRRALRRRATSR